MMLATGLAARMGLVWQRTGGRLAAYDLLMPGDPSFLCQAERCEAHCCKAFSVSLGESEVLRLQGTGRAPIQFLESIDGHPLELPLAHPYLLARRRGRCTLLSGYRCSAYDGRPDACRRYPHEVLFVDPDGKPVTVTADAGQRAIEALLEGGPGRAQPMPLLLRHLECPGFTGPPLALDHWMTVMRETFVLQCGEPAPAALPR